MADIEIDDEEKLQFMEFKRKMNLQAAEAQVGKIEYNLAEATIDKALLRRACQDANALKMGAICVLPSQVKSCVTFLGQNPNCSLIACVSFPHGGDSIKTKIAAVKNAIKDGVDEVEVTAPLAYIKDANWGYVRREFKKLKKAAKKRALRINIESQLLTRQELAKTCTLAADCGITSLRSSSGAYGGGFNTDAISQMQAAVKDRCTIKADNVNTITEMNTAINLGASIIGSRNAADLSRLIMTTAD